MTSSPLRRILMLQPLLAVVIPVAMAALVGYFWLRPQINQEIAQRQLLLARLVSSRINGYLETSIGLIQATGSLAGGNALSRVQYQRLLDDQVQQAEPFSAIYLVDYQGQVQAVGLEEENRFHRQDLLNANFANNPLFKGMTRKGGSLWSETFLSMVTGGLSTAHLSPTPHGVLIAEVDLGKMTRFLKEIGPGDEALILIIDQRGQVIADQEGRRTAIQLNVGDLPLVAAALAGKRETSGHFEFEGRPMIGSVVFAPIKGWHVLVANTVASAYRPQLAILQTVGFGLVIAVALGMYASFSLARRLSRHVEALAGRARDIAVGPSASGWPTTPIAEFNQLSETLQQMADSLHAQGEALRTSERRLSLAMTATADAVWEWHYPTGETYYSPRWYTMLGYEPQQLPMTFATWRELVHPDDYQKTMAVIEQTLVNPGAAGYAVEFRMRHQAGSWLWVLGRGNVVERDAAGQPLQICGTNTDITERKHLEEQLHQSQKMESIGRLAGGVAHDFNNMLTVIIGAAEIAMQKTTADAGLTKLLTQIHMAAERSGQITRQLLAYSRKQVIAPRPVNLNDLIADSQKMLSRLISEDIALSFHPGPDLWTVKLDPSQLDQLLMNLCVNARDAMPNGGSLLLETVNVRIDAASALQHLDSRPGDYVQLTVSDTGMGMDRETQQHIFEPFFTTKGIGEGTGLGLATVYGIVTQNDGFISVYSEPGQGTSFKIFLPRLLTSAAPIETSAPILPAGTGTILLVEDESMLLWTISQLLETMGYTVIKAGSPREGIEICSQQEVRIDLILTDVVMPEMNGREMITRIRELRPDIKVLYMSGYTADVEITRGALEAGMHYIQKPLDMQRLGEQIRLAMA
jgi:PAS domain S-box-containing protein